jgi:hypothetical protein
MLLTSYHVLSSAQLGDTAKYPPICIGRDRDQLMADSVHIGSFCAQASRRGCFGRLRIADVNAATIRRTYDCVSRLTAGWSLTLAVLAALIRSSLGPPSGSCSACGDLLVDDATVAGIAFR